MAGMKKIVVGFDFSEGCVAALKRGRFLASLWGASVEVVHVLQELPYSGATQNKDLVDWMGQLEEEIGEQLSRQVQEVFPENLSVSTQILTGVPYKRLMEYSMETQASLLVLGYGSHSPLEELLLGRTLEGVLQNSLIPVWVEKGQGQEPIQEVLLPTDLSEHSRPAVVLGLQWAKQLEATAHIFHSVEIPFVPRFSMLESEKVGKTLGKVAQEQLNSFVAGLPQDGVSVESVLTYGDVLGEIERFLEANPIGLIVLSTHGHTGLAAKLLGSVAMKILRQAACPILLARPDSLNFSWLKEAFDINR